MLLNPSHYNRWLLIKAYTYQLNAVVQAQIIQELMYFSTHHKLEGKANTAKLQTFRLITRHKLNKDPQRINKLIKKYKLYKIINHLKAKLLLIFIISPHKQVYLSRYQSQINQYCSTLNI